MEEEKDVKKIVIHYEDGTEKGRWKRGIRIYNVSCIRKRDRADR